MQVEVVAQPVQENQNLQNVAIAISTIKDELIEMRTTKPVSAASYSRVPMPTHTYTGVDHSIAPNHISKTENYFAIYNVTVPLQMFHLFAYTLHGIASVWIESIRTEYTDETNATISPLLNWAVLSTMFLTRFTSPILLYQSLEKATHLRDTRSFPTYLSAFQANDVHLKNDLSNDARKCLFILGLKKNSRAHLLSNMPDTLEQAMISAHNFEHGLTGAVTPTVYRDPNAMDVEALPSSTPGRLGKLTAEERQECFRAGKCFKCRAPGHKASQCPSKKATVNALEAGKASQAVELE
ncbi:hypothetical protein GQ42DRAFT_155480 [Ramicandelaber brevisporus]|nr:hypothetical protein GQ42DRAFT_155480 [Ramicandelaber brevisporus]